MKRIAAGVLVVGLVLGAVAWSVAQHGPGPRGFTGPHDGYGTSRHSTVRPGRMGPRQLTDQQIEWMARRHGLTPEQVRQRLESCRALMGNPQTETPKAEIPKTSE